MKRLRSSQLKARLGQHLDSVKAGETILVLERSTLIAKIVPIHAGEHQRLTLQEPVRAGAVGLIKLPRVSFPIIDVVAELRSGRDAF